MPNSRGEEGGKGDEGKRADRQGQDWENRAKTRV